MKVSFSIGPKSAQVIGTLSMSADNIEFLTYESMSDMIKQSTMRRIFFDRIVLAEKFFKNPDEELKMLNDYIVEYSDRTSIVVICKKGSGLAEKFSSIFNSPLYTPVYVSSVTSVFLLECVRDDILSLKTKYYVLDTENAVGVTNKSSQVSAETPVQTAYTKEAKKGFFSGLFGGSKNKSQKVETKNSLPELPNTVGNVASTVAQTAVENAIPQGAETVGNVAESLALGGASKIGSELDLVSNKSTLGFGGSGNFDDAFQENSFEEDDLSIGSFGEIHSDTGFLDEEIENEIENAIQEEEERNRMDEEIEEEFEEVDDSEEVEELEELEEVEEVEEVEPLVVRGGATPAKYRIVVGERGIGSTTYIADNSVKYTDKGRKVLIVDLDYKNNGILSFIDTLKFYKNGFSYGIDNLKVYTEDGIDILSNGYGVDINLSNLVSSGILGNYDVVLFDCPLDCIGVLTKDLLKDSRVMIKVNGNKGSLLNTLNGLTSRENISKELEDMLYSCSKFDIQDKIEGYEEDLEYVKDTNFFGRNNWLNKL